MVSQGTRDCFGIIESVNQNIHLQLLNELRGDKFNLNLFELIFHKGEEICGCLDLIVQWTSQTLKSCLSLGTPCYPTCLKTFFHDFISNICTKLSDKWWPRWFLVHLKTFFQNSIIDHKYLLVCSKLVQLFICTRLSAVVILKFCLFCGLLITGKKVKT